MKRPWHTGGLLHQKKEEEEDAGYIKLSAQNEE